MKLISLFKENHFAADYDFVNSLGSLRDYSQFALCREQFLRHPYNHGFLRKILRLRISSGRLRILVKEVLRNEPVKSRRYDEAAAREELWSLAEKADS